MRVSEYGGPYSTLNRRILIIGPQNKVSLIFGNSQILLDPCRIIKAPILGLGEFTLEALNHKPYTLHGVGPWITTTV